MNLGHTISPHRVHAFVIKKMNSLVFGAIKKLPFNMITVKMRAKCLVETKHHFNRSECLVTEKDFTFNLASLKIFSNFHCKILKVGMGNSRKCSRESYPKNKSNRNLRNLSFCDFCANCSRENLLSFQFLGERNRSFVPV